jgi:hypothetical protein
MPERYQNLDIGDSAAARSSRCWLSELADFVTHHRPCGQLTGDAAEPEPSGYVLIVSCAWSAAATPRRVVVAEVATDPNLPAQKTERSLRIGHLDPRRTFLERVTVTPDRDSLDNLIRPRQQRRRDGEAEGLRCLHVDDQFELHRLFDG